MNAPQDDEEATADIVVVAMELSALPVGEDQGAHVADMAVRFDLQKTPDRPWLGQNAERPTFARHTIARGVHLHWQLPEALRRGHTIFHLQAQALAQVQGQPGLRHLGPALHEQVLGASASTRARLAAQLHALVESAGVRAADAASVAHELAEAAVTKTVFPAVPNRWVVYRWVDNTDQRPSACWIVASDRLSDPDPHDPCHAQNNLSPQVLDMPHDLAGVKHGDCLYKRLGRVFPRAPGNFEIPAGPALSPLTALGYGHPMFAAALPHCYNVFGLLDPLDDVTADAKISYTVVGWYADPANDPVQQALEWGWLAPVTNGRPTRPPKATLLRGQLCDIAFEPGKTPARPAGRVSVAIGHTQTEALSAALAAHPQMHGVSGFESFLNVLQHGLFKRLHDQHPGALKAWDVALHRSDFAALPGGTRWLLRPKAHDAGLKLPALPPNLGQSLAAMNARQEQVDRLQRQLQAQREQLFADWAHYLAIKPTVARSTADTLRDDARRNTARARLAAGKDAVARDAAQLAHARTEFRSARHALLEALHAFCGGSHYQLQASAAQRFWHPTDPVVLLWGADALQAPTPALPNTTFTTNDFDPHADAGRDDLSEAARINDNIYEAICEQSMPNPLPKAAADGPPWRPLLLAWQAEYEEDLVLAPGAEYPANHLTDAFATTLSGSHVPAAPAASGTRSAVAISGLVPLSAAPMNALAEAALDYLKHHPAVAADPQSQSLSQGLQALAELQGSPIRSQALSGFNEALLGRRQSLELPVFDPNAANQSEFDFHLQISRAIASGKSRGCVPGGMFNPLRSGYLRLTRLCLIDVFGRTLSVLGEDDPDDPQHAQAGNGISSDQVIRSERLRPLADATGRCVLHPRIIAPVRLALQWRSAREDDLGPGLDAAQSPVLGWVVADHLDDSLAVYGPQGDALGSLNIDGPLWQGAPGPLSGRPMPAAVPDGALQQMMAGLMAAIESTPERAYLQSLLAAVDAMTETILPKAHTQTPGLALLLGRPLAIVRAALTLELAAPTPIDQRIEVFTAPLSIEPRPGGGLNRLRVPVSLGHRSHKDDGLVGYFVGASDAPATYRSFYVEQFEEAATSSPARVRQPAPDQIAVSAEGDAVQLTMLIDPRAPIHATTGVLPTQAVELPADCFTAALSRMALNFPIGPIIGPRELDAAMPLPVPEEPGYAWRWLQPGEQTWTSRPLRAVPSADLALAQSQALFEGWLQLQPDGAQADPAVEPPDAA